MEQKLVKVPFDVDMAKDITKGDIPGKVVTRDDKNVRIICWDAKSDCNIIVLIDDGGEHEDLGIYPPDGHIFLTGESTADLFLEIPEYLTYKEGDIIYCEVDNGGGDHWKWFSIIKEVDCICGKPYVVSYVDYNLESPHRCGSLEFGKTSDNIGIIRLATEEEKVKFKERLKKSNAPEAKEYLKRFFGGKNSPKVSNSEKFGKKEELAQAYTDKEVQRYHKHSGVIERYGMERARMTSEHESWELKEAYEAGWDAALDIAKGLIKNSASLPPEYSEMVNEYFDELI